MEEKIWVLNHEALTGLWATNLIGIRIGDQWANPEKALAAVSTDLATIEENLATIKIDAGPLTLQAIEYMPETWTFQLL